MKNILLPLIAVACFQTGFSQGDVATPLPDFAPFALQPLQDQAVRDSLALWEEKVYLHTDRTRAEAGEAIFFRAYVYNAPTRRRLSPSGVLKVELRDASNALVTRQYHPLEDGAGEGVVRLPDKLKDGTYQLRAYTRWMQNYGEGQYFSTPIQIGEVAGRAGEATSQELGGITLHPEGGRLLAGVQNRLVVRTSSPEHMGLQGHIVDGEGRAVVPVQDYGSGYGMAIFRPEAETQYQLQTLQGTKVNLPLVEAKGYSLKVNNLETDKLSLEVQPTKDMSGVPVVLKGERGGKTYFIHLLEFEEGPVATLQIPKAGLPTGFMDFSLSGLDETVWTRRPVWIDAPGTLHIEVEPLNTDFGRGREAGFRIRVTDPGGNPVQTDLSVSVARENAPDSEDLPSYISPLGSERATWEGRQNRFLQDLEAQVLAPRAGRDLPGEIRYPVQRSLELHGTAYDLDNNLLANTEIQMLASSEDNLVIREVKTDAAGILHLDSLEVYGETQFVFRTKGEEQEQRLVRVVPVKDSPEAAEDQEEAAQSKVYRKTVKRKNLVEATPAVPFDTTGVIQLDEATVAKRREQQKVVPTLYGLQPNPNDVVYQDPERPIQMDILLRKIPGVQSRVNALGVPVVYHMRRGGGGILWVVDGQVILTRDDPYLSPLTFLTPGDILRMEFYLDVAQTSMFGVITSPNTGIIVIYTRNGMFMDYTDRKKGGLLFKGYEPSLDYEAWLAERRQDRKLRKEAPQTLYWNPEVRTDKKGEALIRFESPADYTRVQLRVETLTREGLVGSFRAEY